MKTRVTAKPHPALLDTLRHGLLLRLTQLDAQRHEVAKLLRQLPKEKK